ncbi:MAG: hypothetical protein JWN82_427 [Candidatus Saccharibacteria bacterium]|nr:hypothetical protein [Candidatus Saccharibacteria bacterium]
MKIINKTTATVLLVLILLAQSACIALSFDKIHKLETAKPADDLLSISMNALNASGLSQPAVSVGDNKVYFPELRLALPLNDTTTSLVYHGRSVGNAAGTTGVTYDVTTRGLASLSPVGFQTRLACDPIRLAFEAKANPFNPYEKNNAAVTLADGRTLQIYAFSEPACDAQWQAVGVKPDVLKNIFKQATSY